MPPGVCEMKRLYIRPAFRGLGLGRKLIDRLAAEAVAAGYREMVLDTLPMMPRAIGMYRSAGFVETEPYTFNPVPGAMYIPGQSGRPRMNRDRALYRRDAAACRWLI